MFFFYIFVIKIISWFKYKNKLQKDRSKFLNYSNWDIKQSLHNRIGLRNNRWVFKVWKFLSFKLSINQFTIDSLSTSIKFNHIAINIRYNWWMQKISFQGWCNLLRSKSKSSIRCIKYSFTKNTLIHIHPIKDFWLNQDQTLWINKYYIKIK